MYKVGIITASDKGFRGEREDISGPTIKDSLPIDKYTVLRYVVLPDEIDELKAELIDMCDNLKLDLILTTGGTGFSVRDVTPEATLSVIEKNANGISEAIRYYSLQITPKAMLTRAVSGIRGKTLIINLPGSPKAVKETLEFVLNPVTHGLDILLGNVSECAR